MAARPDQRTRPARGGAARPAAGVRRLLDLRVRRAHARRPGRRARLRRGARRRRGRVVAHLERRALRQLAAPVERGAVLRVHGHPPVGQVLDGGLARQAGADLGHRRGRVRGLDRHGVHRLPVAVELRLAVDQRRGQGRHQLDRHRCLVQRAEPGPDAAVARGAAAPRGRRRHRAARRPGPPPRRRAAAATASRVTDMATHDSAPHHRAPVDHGRPPTRTTSPTRPYDLVKEFVIALRRGQPAHRRARRGLLLAGRAGDHDGPWAQAAPADVVATATGELAGTTTSATYGAPYNRTPRARSCSASRCRSWAASGSRSTPPTLVLQPLAGVSADPRLRRRPGPVACGRRRPAADLGHGVRRRPRQGAGGDPADAHGRLRSGAGPGEPAS